MGSVHEGPQAVRYCQVGCDIDGVLASGFVPAEAEFCAISGRRTDDWDRTIGQIGASRPIYLRPQYFPGEAGEWKAAIIMTTGITKFYEDMRDQAEVIRRICPRCVVHLVEGGRVVEVMGG
jgi:hypothetical protein